MAAAGRTPKSLERVISKAGLGSRTEARAWILAGRVAVNGRGTRDPDRRVDAARDRIRLDGRPIVARDHVYVLLHKPAGYVTTYRDPEGRPTVYDLITGVPTFVSPAGRLDLDSSGLLILTNDTAFADRVTSPDSHVPKTYRVTASRVLTDLELQRLAQGVVLRDGPTRPAAVTRVGDDTGRTMFDITLTEGRNRQVRRMVEAVGARVRELVRIRIGSIVLGRLPAGAWRQLTRAEIRSL